MRPSRGNFLAREVDRLPATKFVCVACGEVGEYGKHRCDPKRENQIEGGRKSHTELGHGLPRAYSDRLKEGFEMLDDEHWWDDEA